MKDKKTLHFIGIGGIGMSALAKLALEGGLKVTGSDVKNSPLIELLVQRGALIDLKQTGALITPEKTVVFSSGVEPQNVELQKAKKIDCPIVHRSECLQMLIANTPSLAVAGTHGKTGTSALLATVFDKASYAIGGILQATQTNAALREGEYFVIEADESDGSFVNYTPTHALITNIDKDHMDYWEGEEKLFEGFSTFANRVEKTLFVHESVPKVIPGTRYGLSGKSPLSAKNISQNGPLLHFDIHLEGKVYKEIQLRACGNHIAENALGVFGLSLELGISEERIREAFYHYEGVKRRLEYRWEEGDQLFMDDYAHHPVEIEATLKGLKRMYPEKNIIALFQPHRYSRTKECLSLYNDAFQNADQVVITDIFSAGEAPIPGISPETIAKTLNTAHCVVPRNELVDYITSYNGKNPLFITLGAGDITHLANEAEICLKRSQ